MKKLFYLFSVTVLAIVIYACSDDDNSNATDDDGGANLVTNADVIANYADIVHQNYLDSYNAAITMQTAINDFVDNPSESGFTAAKEAWLAAREPYGQTEVVRETNSPVDVDESGNTPWGLGNEGQMNAWPIDESYIDYVQAGTEAYAGTFMSIISDGAITIDEATLANANEDASDKSISTGWHAIEFLLWGQDNTSPAANQPGQRLYTDYTTADDADRRGQYLKVATSLLVSDLNDLVQTWATGGTYRTVFEGLDETTAMQQLLNGAFFIAGDELSAERMIAPVDSTDGIENSGQEDEHSCFADNTHRDIVTNTLGVYNVVFGEYESISGASFYDLVEQADSDQAASLKAAADDTIAKVNAISDLADDGEPFDFLITQELSTDTQFGPVMQAVVALQTWGDEISASASAIGVNLQ